MTGNSISMLQEWCIHTGSHTFCRLAFVEHYASVLQRVSAVHKAGAPRAAMKLFGDEHFNIYEMVTWACTKPPPESAPVYSDLLWTSVDVLSLRLDETEKLGFCEVCCSLYPIPYTLHPTYCNSTSQFLVEGSSNILD